MTFRTPSSIIISEEELEAYLNTHIKKIMEQFPAVEAILNDYNIGCAPCNVGTCLLKDVVGIHNLSEEEEKGLLLRIAKVIYPDKDIPIPKIAKRQKPAGINYSPPMQKLVDEHKLIKKLVALIPKQVERINLESSECRAQILAIIDFIRSYADKYHHAKEEDILFKYFDENLDIIKIMYEDHTNARDHVKAIVEGVEKKDEASVKQHLTAYHELLPDHIKREDEILYVWMDRNFSVTQVGELFSKFMEVDNSEPGVQEKYETFVEELEEKLNA